MDILNISPEMAIPQLIVGGRANLAMAALSARGLPPTSLIEASTFDVSWNIKIDADTLSVRVIQDLSRVEIPWDEIETHNFRPSDWQKMIVEKLERRNLKTVAIQFDNKEEAYLRTIIVRDKVVRLVAFINLGEVEASADSN